MKKHIVVLFLLLLISSSGYPALQSTQKSEVQGRRVPITQLGPKRSGPRVSFTDVSGITEPLSMVIRDRETWSSMWKRIYRGPAEAPILEIDFPSEMIILVAMGARPTSTYGIIIDSVYDRGDRLEANVRSISPGKYCITLQMVTAPVDIVRLERLERPVSFIVTEVKHECR